MHNTSQMWKDLVAADAPKDIKAEINGVEYTNADIEYCRVTGALFSSPSVGNTPSRQLELRIKPKGETIPKAASIVLYVRLNSCGSNPQTSEWIKKGEFHINTRRYDESTGILTINGFDAMMMGEWTFVMVFPSLRIGGTGLSKDDYNWGAQAVVNAIASFIGVEVDARTNLIPVMSIRNLMPDGYYGYSEENGPAVVIPYSCRQILGYIAAMHGGNWIITDEGKLWLCSMMPSGYLNYEVIGDENLNAISVGGILISISSLSGANSDGGQIAILKSMREYHVGEPLSPWKYISVNRHGEALATLGSSYDMYAGRRLNVELPFQEDTAETRVDASFIASIVMGSVRGAIYRPFEARDTIIDPAIEIGDSISIDGLASIIVKSDWTIDHGLFRANLSAPGEEDGEFYIPYQSSVGVSTQRYVDSAISSYATNNALSIRIVRALPEGHETQNVLWVIPDE